VEWGIWADVANDSHRRLSDVVIDGVGTMPAWGPYPTDEEVKTLVGWMKAEWS
jgi:cytochrome c5